MSTGHYQQIERAQKVHSGITPTLRNSPVILTKPVRRIYHDAEKQTTDSDGGNLEQMVKRIGFNGDWIHYPHHDLTMSMISKGIVPSNIGNGCPGDPVPLRQALEAARERGHDVPDSYFVDRPVSSAEESAYYVARDLLYLQTGSPDSPDGRRLVRALTSKYAIPNPKHPTLTPYFVDQLWVLLHKGPRVRLIAVEIDSERQLGSEAQLSARERDMVLSSLGYEVYHLAGWWCRVDSWRAISELLQVTGVNSEACNELACGGLRSIRDYVCASCHQPVIRWDSDWINEGEDGELLHEECYWRLVG